MTLDDYVKLKIAEIRYFEHVWKENMTSNPENFPGEMLFTDWDELFDPADTPPIY